MASPAQVYTLLTFRNDNLVINKWIKIKDELRFLYMKKQKMKVQVKKCNLARGVKAERLKTRTRIVYLAQVLPMTACVVAFTYYR